MCKRCIQLSAALISLLLVFSCTSNKSRQEQAPQTNVSESHKVGSDRDDHGCIGSAGYQWSELLEDCIRPFEKGIRLSSSNDVTDARATYLVFSADSSQIEIFFPEQKIRPIVTRHTEEDGEVVWTSETVKRVLVKCTKGIWGVYDDEMLVYVSNVSQGE